MSDIVLPIEISAFDYDFKVPYYPESDECKVPYKATPDAAAYDLCAAEIKKSYRILTQLYRLI